MATIHDQNELTVSQLSTMFGVSSSAMQRLIEEFKEEFPVHRRVGPDDGLKTRLFLVTPMKVLASRFKMAQQPEDRSANQTLRRMLHPERLPEKSNGSVTSMSSLETRLARIEKFCVENGMTL